MFKNKISRYGVYLLFFFVAGTFLSKSEAEKFGSKEYVLVEYIKNGEYDSSLKNVKALAKIGGMFGNHNYSLILYKEMVVLFDFVENCDMSKTYFSLTNHSRRPM